MKEIVARRICPSYLVDHICIMGKCDDCNKYEMVTISRIENMAVEKGYGREFIDGRLHDFYSTEVEREV